MVNELKAEVQTQNQAKKGGFWSKFGNFLMMGGWLVLVVVIVGIIIAISAMTGGK
jgi:hypothetical protein